MGKTPIITKDTFEIPAPKGFREAMKKVCGQSPDGLTLINNKYGITLLLHTKEGSLIPLATGTLSEIQHVVARIYATK